MGDMTMAATLAEGLAFAGMKRLQEMGDAADKGMGGYPELIDSYAMQSNWTGTGIVEMGGYARMHEADLDMITFRVKGEKP